MTKHWVRLTDSAGEPSAWLNLAAVAMVSPDGRGGLRIELIDERERDPGKLPVVTHRADVAAILAYLAEVTRVTTPQDGDATPLPVGHGAPIDAPIEAHLGGAPAAEVAALILPAVPVRPAP